jgi:hypothetical protein
VIVRHAPSRSEHWHRQTAIEKGRGSGLSFLGRRIRDWIHVACPPIEAPDTRRNVWGKADRVAQISARNFSTLPPVTPENNASMDVRCERLTQANGKPPVVKHVRYWIGGLSLSGRISATIGGDSCNFHPLDPVPEKQ